MSCQFQVNSIFSKATIVTACNAPFFLQGVKDLPDYGKIEFSKSKPIPLEDLCPDAPDVAIDLLKQFLVYPSKQRIASGKVR